MWSPSGAVGRAELDNTCWPALSHFVLTWLLGPKQWHKPSLGCSSCPQPNPEPLPWVPILAPGIFLLLKTEGRVTLGGKGRILSFAKWYFIWDSAQEGISVRAGEGVCGGNQAAKCDAHSIFPRVLLSVPSGCLPSQGIQEWHLQLPTKATWGCMTKTPAAIYHGPHYQRKSCSPAAGRGKSPWQCVRMMWGLGRRHGL